MIYALSRRALPNALYSPTPPTPNTNTKNTSPFLAALAANLALDDDLEKGRWKLEECLRYAVCQPRKGNLPHNITSSDLQPRWLAGRSASRASKALLERWKMLDGLTIKTYEGNVYPLSEAGFDDQCVQLAHVVPSGTFVWCVRRLAHRWI